MKEEIEKYRINNLEDVCESIAGSIKNMSINDIMDDKFSLGENIASIIRGNPNCKEIKGK